MAINPYVNKVVYGDDTVMDISDTTATESDVADGAVFYKANGARSVGTAPPSAPEWGDITGTLSDQTDLQSALDSKFSRAEQQILGAKNLLDKTRIVGVSSGLSVTQTETGVYAVTNSAGTYKRFYYELDTDVLGDNTDYIFSTDIIVTSGSGRIQIQGNDGGSYVTIESEDWSATTSVSIEFNSGVYNSIGIIMYVTTDTVTSCDVLFDKPMLRLASDPDATYVPHAKTNRDLTHRLNGKQDTLTFDNVPTNGSSNPVKSGGVYSIKTHQVVRTGVTASANGQVRIPASGSDSRFTSNCVVVPICDPKSDGTPYKFKSCVTTITGSESTGYATITVAEAISNVTIGVQITNY